MRPAVCLQTDVRAGAPGSTVREKHCPCVHSLKTLTGFAAYWSLNCLWLTVLLRFVVLDPASLRFPRRPVVQVLGSYYCGPTHAESCRRYAWASGIVSSAWQWNLAWTQIHVHPQYSKCTHIQPSHALLWRTDKQCALYFIHLCVHIYICVCGIDFSSSHAPRCLYISAW